MKLRVALASMAFCVIGFGGAAAQDTVRYGAQFGAQLAAAEVTAAGERRLDEFFDLVPGVLVQMLRHGEVRLFSEGNRYARSARQIRTITVRVRHLLHREHRQVG